VFIPKQQVQESNLNYLEILRSITPEQLLKKQQAIARIAPRLQYSVVRALILSHPLSPNMYRALANIFACVSA
jgi:hypothetical protein